MAWRNLSLRVGVVNVPLGLDPATDKGAEIVAHTYDRATKARVKQAWTADGETLAAETFRAYDVEGELVEAERIADDCPRDFVVSAMVAPLDALWLDSPYFVSAGKGAGDGAGLLAKLLRDSGAWLAGEIRLMDRKRSAVLRYSDAAGCLVLSVLTFGERIRWAKGEAAGATYVEPSDAVIAQGEALLAALADADFAPAETDTVAQRLRDVLAGTVSAPSDETPTDSEAESLLDAMRVVVEGYDAAKAKRGAKAKASTAKV